MRLGVQGWFVAPCLSSALLPASSSEAEARAGRVLEGRERLATGHLRSGSDLAQPPWDGRHAQASGPADWHGSYRQLGWQSDGLALPGASVTGDSSGSKSPACEGPDGDPKWTWGSKGTTQSALDGCPRFGHGRGWATKSADPLALLKTPTSCLV